MRSFYASLVAFALVLHAEPACAEREQPQTQVAAQDENENPIAGYLEQFYTRKYSEALASADKFHPDPTNKAGQAIVATMRGSALLGLKRKAEATELFAKAEQLAPHEPYPKMLQFDAGLATENFEISLAALDSMISRMPDIARELDIQSVVYLLSKGEERQDERNDDRRIALARMGFGGETESGDYFSKRAVDVLVRRGDLSGARELLRYIDEPQIIENMLIQRRFAALWPEIEAKAGSHLEHVRASAAASAKRYYAEDPTDNRRLQLLVNALRHTGNLDEAIEFRAKLPNDSAAMSSADEDMGWAVNNVALALHEAGRADEADKLFASLNEAPMPPEYWRVSMKINRLELLVGDGKFNQAMPLIEPTAKVEGTPFADQLVRRLRYCTLHGLGRSAEAEQLLPDLMAHKKDAPSATIDGLLCANRIDEAEKIVLESFGDPDFQEDMIRRLQLNPLTSDDPSIWTKGWIELRKRPAVAVKFDQLARDLPERFLPPKS